MNTLKEKIYDVIKAPHLANLATLTDEGNPWTRYVIAVGSEDLTICFSSFLDGRKIEQIQAHPDIHLNCGVESMVDMKPYLQIQGIATVSTSESDRKSFWNEGLASIFTGPDDLRYAVVIVKPYRIEYCEPQDMGPPSVWEK